MPLGFTVSNITATGARLNFTGMAGNVSAIEVQLSPRLDFKWCVCPIFSVAAATPQDIVGLNQVQSYYGRARERYLDGTASAWTPIFPFRTPLAQAQVTAPAAVLIEPAIVMVPEPIVSWSAAGPGVVAGFPVTNLGRDAPVAWRSLANAQNVHTFMVETAGSPIDTIALLNSNVPENGTVIVTGSHAPWGVNFIHGPVPFRASQNLPGRYGYHALIEFAAAQQYRWFVVQITAAVPGGLLHLEHAVVGQARRSKNHAIEKKETPIDLGALERSRTGIPDRLAGFRMRRVEFDLALMKESQYETLYSDLGRKVGQFDPVLIVPNSKRNAFLHDRICYGNLEGGSVTNPASPVYTRTFAVDSII